MSLFVEIGRVPEGLVELWWCASASHEYIGHSIQFQFPQFQSYDKAAAETARRELKHRQSVKLLLVSEFTLVLHEFEQE